MEKTRLANIPVEGLQEALSGRADVNHISSIMFQALFTCTAVAKQNDEIYGPKYTEVQNVLKKLALSVNTQLDEFSTEKEVLKFHNKTMSNYLYLVKFFNHEKINQLFNVLKYEFTNFRIRWYWSTHSHSSLKAEESFIKGLKFANHIVDY